MRTRSLLLAGGLVAGLAFFLLVLWDQSPLLGEPGNAPAAKQTPRSGAQPAAAPDDRAGDRAAIRKMVQSFVEAFERGDATQAAAFLTTGAELIPDDAPPVRGRKAIQTAFADYLAKQPKRKITLETEALRFTSRDTAVEEGHILTTVDGESAMQRYSLLHVREDGKWLLALIREWASEKAELRDLDWLIGTWEAKRTEVELQATYEWFGDKGFIRGNIRVREKDRTLNVTQYIGTDPRTGGLRLWVFESNGVFTEGTCTRDGDAWLFETNGTLASGGMVSATNILVRISNDTMTWQPVNLTIGDEIIGDLPPVKVTRAKATK